MSKSYSAQDFDSDKVKVGSETLSVPFVSALVLRREIETLLATNILALADSSLRTSHPVIFWNLIYYLRRLDIPTHMYTWIAKNVQIRCVYDSPEQHLNKRIIPLYITNHAVSPFFILKFEEKTQF
uniref:Uncharacterized protein n=1 Tax=Panagrolaimus davidi TaxID=227884 RepID=A0A914PCY2_9BILA